MTRHDIIKIETSHRGVAVRCAKQTQFFSQPDTIRVARLSSSEAKEILESISSKHVEYGEGR